MKGTAEDIILALIDTVNQACQVSYEDKKIYCSHMCLSAYEDAFSILEIEGYMKQVTRGKHKGKYLLSWAPIYLKTT